MKTIAFFNRKGGVGSTLFAAHTDYYGHALGLATLGVSLEQNLEMAQYLTPELPWSDATAEIPPGPWDLRVLDVWSHTDVAHLLRPTLWVMPMSCPNGFNNGMRAAAEELVGPVLCVWNRVMGDAEALPSLRVPEALAGRVTFADVRIPRRPELDVLPGCLWAHDTTSPGATDMLLLVREIMARAGVVAPATPPPPFERFPIVRGSKCRDIHRGYRAREDAARAAIIASLGTE